ncbi:lasso peptide biosynthesis B2 protein [Actinomadura sp. 9N215]|uniref:lasso peptide biosynthesis B2 protein n=1 Tax=Actinomadura sp. 9N215 TaxID=3375150 RepID=UPI003788555A
MSEPQVMAIDRAAFTLRERTAARVAVLAARILAKQPPQRLRRVLRIVGKGARPATYDEAARARRVVVNTSWRCTGPKGCLPRSIATVLLCRLRGTVPTWCVGVRIIPPFGAHAWVIAEGRDVDEPFPEGYHRTLISVEPPVGTTP